MDLETTFIMWAGVLSDLYGYRFCKEMSITSIKSIFIRSFFNNNLS